MYHTQPFYSSLDFVWDNVCIKKTQIIYMLIIHSITEIKAVSMHNTIKYY